uniref:Sodium/calcium exchanger 3-like n=1 Tax=Saccoglossus kowalevskii TaxID=10224 RepID=A0ABM0MXF7_SACKO|nr:PREDICTED: sodium/calcium exchanger 3-like [Saccoglossus kowalevskii]
MSNSTTDPDAYLCYDKGLILPIVNESTWSTGARITVYLIGLIYCLYGVSIITGIFMSSIEVITSKTKTVNIANPKAPGGTQKLKVRVWNSTVANLTLVTLGSRTTEILLCLIEIVGNGFHAGYIGPSTIIGSAAFNLLVITAVCIACPPIGEVRYIKQIKVSTLTAAFSIIAYIWLLLVLLVITPNIVELWEAICTFICFPILVVIAFMADKGYRGRNVAKDDDKQALLGIGNVTREGVADVMKEMGKHPDITQEQAATIAAIEAEKNSPHTRAWYRVSETRNMTGGQKLIPTVDPKLLLAYDQVKMGSSISIGSTLFPEIPIVEFAAASCAVYEHEKRVRVWINRKGNIHPQIVFKFETLDGTAEAGSDYIAQRDTMVFGSNETQKFIDIDIIDDNEWEPDEVFFVKLSVDSKSGAKLGKKHIMQITIINDEEPGTFEFTMPSYLVKESIGVLQVPVSRNNGTDGKVVLKWKTTDMTAISGKDYEGGKGELVFEHGEKQKSIDIPIVDDQEYEKDESFKLELLEVSDGAKLGKTRTSVITIVNDDELNNLLDRVVSITNVNLDRLRIGNASWADQFKEAMNVNGGDIESATWVIFALVPPPSFLDSGGWISFCVALTFIGVLTTIIGSLGSIFGCLINMKDSVTGLTFVTLGTCIVDLCVSKKASVGEKYADCCMTGSYSVYVFFGLGLSWVTASIYWTSKGLVFVVDSSSFSFSVMMYIICAIMCLSLLVLRRFTPFFGKAELGGPTAGRYLSSIFLLLLWCLYILLCSFQSYDYIDF